MRATRLIVLVISVAAGLLLAPSIAGAHDMNATVKVGADSVRVEVFFEEDIPAEFAKVSVTDATGTEVAAGTADERGVWTFPTPIPGQYTLSATCIGHAAPVSFTVAAAEAPPVVYTGDRLNKTVGLTAGAGGLLGVSALVWLLRRRRG